MRVINNNYMGYENQIRIKLRLFGKLIEVKKYIKQFIFKGNWDNLINKKV